MLCKTENKPLSLDQISGWLKGTKPSSYLNYFKEINVLYYTSAAANVNSLAIASLSPV